ncbi:MAG: hypothetical protein KAJ66_02080 [Candidatus Omnitrophica bacterium]|nr:hypothetical protein [Candidatus Omnitrophota bacterium]
MKKKILSITFICLCLFITAANKTLAETKNEKSIISYGADKKLEVAWKKIDNHTKKEIEHYLVIELGLSSTGHIELIGNYRLTEDDEFGKQRHQILHFIQKDLLGSRLFWSCLVNVDNYKVKILYPDTNKELIGHLKHD